MGAPRTRTCERGGSTAEGGCATGLLSSITSFLASSRIMCNRRRTMLPMASSADQGRGSGSTATSDACPGRRRPQAQAGVPGGWCPALRAWLQRQPHAGISEGWAQPLAYGLGVLDLVPDRTHFVDERRCVGVPLGRDQYPHDVGRFLGAWQRALDMPARASVIPCAVCMQLGLQFLMLDWDCRGSGISRRSPPPHLRRNSVQYSSTISATVCFSILAAAAKQMPCAPRPTPPGWQQQQGCASSGGSAAASSLASGC